MTIGLEFPFWLAERNRFSVRNYPIKFHNKTILNFTDEAFCNLRQFRLHKFTLTKGSLAKNEFQLKLNKRVA